MTSFVTIALESTTLRAHSTTILPVGRQCPHRRPTVMVSIGNLVIWYISWVCVKPIGPRVVPQIIIEATLVAGLQEFS
jgi:hypothetical protein